MYKWLKVLLTLILIISPLRAENVYPVINSGLNSVNIPMVLRREPLLKITNSYYVLKMEPKMTGAYDYDRIAVISPLKVSIPSVPKPQPKVAQKAKPKWLQTGIMKSTNASYYARDRITAWDHPHYHYYQRYCWKEATAAHKTLPLGSKVRVFYNGKHVDVLITDRGPYVDGRDLDLSPYAMAQLAPDGLSWNQIVNWMQKVGVLRGVKWCRLRLEK